MHNKKQSHPLSETEIDALIIAQADDPSAWEDVIEVELPRTVTQTTTLIQRFSARTRQKVSRTTQKPPDR